MTIARTINEIYDCLPGPDCCVERVPLHNLLGLRNGTCENKRPKEMDSIVHSKEAVQVDATDHNVLVKFAIFACQWMTSAALISI